MQTEQVRLIYVAGYGRSGSTLLDLLLGSHPAVFGAGELSRLYEGTRDGTPCSCGKTVSACPIWNDVRQRVFDALPMMDCAEAARITRRTESFPGSRRELDRYIAVWSKTFESISAVTQRQIVVDSSKSTRYGHNRLPHLLAHLGGRTDVLHLVRNPRGVMWSSRRGSNRRLEEGRPRRAWGRMARALMSWTIVNLSIELLKRRHGAMNLLQLRYEDLATAPGDTLERVGQLLELSFGDTLERLNRQEPLDPGHGIAGNRMRRSGPVVLRFDDQWLTELPRRAKALSYIALPLMKKYHYK